MLFACIDDKVAELDRAEAAVVARGHTRKRIEVNGMLADWVREIKEAEVVLTDLFFNPSHPDSGHHAKYAAAEPPAGLLVAIQALVLGKIIVICTDGNEKSGGHHSEGLSWIYDCFMSCKAIGHPRDLTLPRKRSIRLGWDDDKDWANAVAIAEAIAEVQKQHTSPEF